MKLFSWNGSSNYPGGFRLLDGVENGKGGNGTLICR